jgi:hypothetical protein
MYVFNHINFLPFGFGGWSSFPQPCGYSLLDRNQHFLFSQSRLQLTLCHVYVRASITPLKTLTLTSSTEIFAETFQNQTNYFHYQEQIWLVLSRVSVTEACVWIGESIYWIFTIVTTKKYTTPNYY